MALRSRFTVAALAASTVLAAGGCSSPPSTDVVRYGPRVEVAPTDRTPGPIRTLPVYLGSGDGSGAMAYARLLVDRRAAYEREMFATGE